MTKHRLFEIEGQFVTQVFATEHLAGVAAAAASSAAKDVAEDLAEQIAEDIAAATTKTTPAPRRVKSGVAMAVIDRALRGVGKHFIGLLAFLEGFQRRCIIRVPIGMKFLRQTPVGLFNVRFRSVTGYAQHFVIVALRHAFPARPAIRKGRGRLPAPGP